MNFERLITAVREGLREPGEPPPTMAVVAELAGVTRQYLWCLARGSRSAPAWTEERIAKAWGIDVERIRRALRKSRREAGVE